MGFEEKISRILNVVKSGASVDAIHAEVLLQFVNRPPEMFERLREELIQAGMAEEDVNRICQDVNEGLLFKTIDKSFMETGHPVRLFVEENRGLKEYIRGPLSKAMKYYRENSDLGKMTFIMALEELSKVGLHYLRKELILFPLMVKAGYQESVDEMQAQDDMIRTLLDESIEAVKTGDKETVLTKAEKAVGEIMNMVAIEEALAAPLLKTKLADADWKEVAIESNNFGFVFLNGRQDVRPSDSMAWLNRTDREEDFERDEPIRLPSGYFTNEELRAVLNTLPCGLTFVNKNNEIQYYSEAPHRVFPRDRSALGKNIETTSPERDLVDVDEFFEPFRKGKKNIETFWVQRGGRLILLRVIAVYSVVGEYLGVIELSEDITDLRRLGGERKLPGS